MTSGESVVDVQTKKAKKIIVSFLSNISTPLLVCVHQKSYILYFMHAYKTEKRRWKSFSSFFSGFLLANANAMMMMMKWMTFHENRVSVETFRRVSSFLSYLL